MTLQGSHEIKFKFFILQNLFLIMVFFFRFIQWGSCCCSGGNVKDENGHLMDECRDKFVKHPIKTKACKKLAQLPSVIPLYSG